MLKFSSISLGSRCWINTCTSRNRMQFYLWRAEVSTCKLSLLRPWCKPFFLWVSSLRIGTHRLVLLLVSLLQSPWTPLQRGHSVCISSTIYVSVTYVGCEVVSQDSFGVVVLWVHAQPDTRRRKPAWHDVIQWTMNPHQPAYSPARQSVNTSITSLEESKKDILIYDLRK